MANNANQKYLQVFFDGETRLLHFVLGNGLRLAINVDTHSPAEVRDYAMVHGYNQTIRDCVSGFSQAGDFSGGYAAMAKRIETLKTSWSGRGTSVSDLAQAIANVKQLDLAEAVAMVGTFSEAKRARVLGTDSVKAEIERLKAERAAARAASLNPDMDDLDAALEMED